MLRRFALLALFACAPPAAAQRGGFVDTDCPVSPAGVRAVIDLPPGQCMRNVGGSDGAGLCVYTSGQMAGRWQYVPEMEGFQDYMRTVPGGGTPQKFERDLQAYCAKKGVPVPSHVQHTGGDTAFLEACFKTRRMPCMTYSGRDNFYRQYVPHMVSGAHMDATSGAIMDNNRPGKTTWMSRADFLERWKEKGGWAYVWLAPPPPPDPNGTGPSPSPTPDPAPSPPRPRPRPCPCPGGPEGQPDWPMIGQQPGDDYEWRPNADGGWNLHRGTLFVGTWWNGGWYPEAGAGQVLAKPTGFPPIAPPSVAGVEASALQQIGVRYWVDGVEVTRAQAFAALGAELPDDSGRFFLTHFGTPAEGQSAVARLKADPVIGRFASAIHIRSIGLDSWITRERFGNRFGIAFQQPAEKGGKVEAFVPASGADDAKLAEAVRRCLDPDYRPAPQPTPGPRPFPGPGPAPKPGPAPSRDVPGPLAALAVAAYLITRKK